MSVSRKCSGAGFAGWLPSGRYYWSFWWLGLINNLGYVVVLSSAKSLAASFDAGDSIGAINWVLVGLGMAVRLLNTTNSCGTKNGFLCPHVTTHATGRTYDRINA